ncbi:DUF4375 domain-containing protein [Neorhizobium galegae]|nr:DUF4375 domain-containing protein [Neorhizobium galegae]
MKVYLPPIDLQNDEDLIENFHSAIWAFHSGQVGKLRKELSDIQCPEIEIYCALRYEGEVRNGGHNQYIFNLGGDQEEFAVALSGLRLIGADKQADILHRMIQWTKAEPDEVQRRLETFPPHVEQPVLEQLDDELFAIPEEVSLYPLAANWRRANGDIEIVTNEECIAIDENLRNPTRH